MKLKRMLAWVLVLALALTVPVYGEGLKAGTYTKTTNAMQGPLTLEMVVADGKIESLKVTEHVETPGVGGYAAEVVPQRVVDSQSLAVDTVTGATITSVIILNAAGDLLAEAGADVAAYKVKPEAAPATDVDMTADVVIVGGGGAGLAAAVSATSKGASVILIEKTGFLGGNSIVAGGIYNAPDPKLQDYAEIGGNPHSLVEEAVAEEPVNEAHKALIEAVKADYEAFKKTDKKLFDSPNWFALQTWNGGDKIADLAIVENMANHSKDALDWLHSMGFEYKDQISQGAGSLYPRTHSAILPNGVGYIKAFTDTLDKASGYTLLMNTTGESLITENGRVTGVNAVGKDGEKVTLHATKGVILATGGFASNVKLRQEYCEGEKWPDLGPTLPTSNVSGVTGDGIFMAQEVGADLVNMEQIQLLHVCNPKTGHTYDIISGTTVAGIFVNQEGKRFIREDGRRDEISKAILSQTGGKMYLLFSADLAPDPNTTKALGGQTLQYYLDTNKDYVTADTIEELAEKLGMPAEELKATADAFNQHLAAGTEDEFGRVTYFQKIETAPFYAYPRSPAAHHTMGGVRIDTETHALDKEGNVIPGLYCAGEITGVVHGGNRLGGNALVDFTVYGRIAGESVVNDNP